MKYIKFVDEEVSEKSISELPRINEKLNIYLIHNNYTKARQLIGKYIELDDEEKFKKWFIDLIHSGLSECDFCRTLDKMTLDTITDCIKEWLKNHFK